MDLGLTLPQHADVDLRRDVSRTATRAEASGFASLWVVERLVYPVSPRQDMYDIPGMPWEPAYRNYADPLTVLAVAAACTESIRVGTSVLVASLHQPVRLAASLAAIDEVAGPGRLVVGLGSGWMYDEFDAVGAPRERRGQDLQESVETIRAVWSDDPVSYRGATIALDDVFVGRSSRRRPPIMLGGGFTPAAQERIARCADGYVGAGQSGAAVVGLARRIEALATDAGRPGLHLRVVNLASITLLEDPFPGDDRPAFVGDFDQVVADLRENERSGVDELIIQLQAQANFRGSDDAFDTALALREAVLQPTATGRA